MVGPRPVGTVAGSTDGRATVLPSTTQFDGKSGTTASGSTAEARPERLTATLRLQKEIVDHCSIFEVLSLIPCLLG
jgi:hypothetical protein